MSANCTTTKEMELVHLDAVKLRQLCEKYAMHGFRPATYIAKLPAHRLEGAWVQLAVI